MNRPDRPLLAIALRMAAMAILSTMFMLVKYAGQRGVSAPEMIFWRQAMSVPILLSWLAATGRLKVLATSRMATHARRAATGTIGMFCNVSAAMLLPLPEATTLGFTAPLFAVLITALILREQVGKWRWTAVVLGFLGVMIIAQPGQTPVPALGVVAGIGSGVIVSIVSFQIRDLARTEEPISCVFWFAFYGSVMTAILLPLYMKPHTPEVWMLLVCVGLTGTVAQFLMAASLRHGQVVTVVAMDYTSLIWATLYGFAVWGHVPPSTTWLGAPIIICAGLLIIWREHRLARRISPTSAIDEGATEEAAPGAQGT
ncbi:MAG TPA: DMT family transporter [Novosphingobium sp.]|nr:DMT family transporter [Novosphingobium sp.]